MSLIAEQVIVAGVVQDALLAIREYPNEFLKLAALVLTIVAFILAAIVWIAKSWKRQFAAAYAKRMEDAGFLAQPQQEDHDHNVADGGNLADSQIESAAIGLEPMTGDQIAPSTVTSTSETEERELSEPDDEEDAQETKEAHDFVRIVKAAADNSWDEAEKAFEELKEKDPEASLEWTALYHTVRFEHGFVSARADLRKLADIPDVRVFALSLLAETFSNAGNYAKALEIQKEGLEASKPGDGRVDAAVKVAKYRFEVEGAQQTIKFLQQQIRELGEEPDGDVSQLYQALAEVYEKADNQLMQVVCLQAAVADLPPGSSKRFNLAYLCSEQKLLPLAVYNYQVHSRYTSEPLSTNNLGAVFSSVGLTNLAYSYYWKASEKGSTLARGNLLSGLIEHGFLDAAEEHLEGFELEESSHQNLTHALSNLKSARRQMNQTKEDIQSGVNDVYRFFAKVIRAFFDPVQIAPRCGKWQSGDGTGMTVKEHEKGVLLDWDSLDKSFVPTECGSKACVGLVTTADSSSSFSSRESIVGFLLYETKESIRLMVLESNFEPNEVDFVFVGQDVQEEVETRVEEAQLS